MWWYSVRLLQLWDTRHAYIPVKHHDCCLNVWFHTWSSCRARLQMTSWLDSSLCCVKLLQKQPDSPIWGLISPTQQSVFQFVVDLLGKITLQILSAQSVMSGLVKEHLGCSKELVFLHAFSVSSANTNKHRDYTSLASAAIKQLTLVLYDLFK